MLFVDRLTFLIDIAEMVFDERTVYMDALTNDIEKHTMVIDELTPFLYYEEMGVDALITPVD